MPGTVINVDFQPTKEITADELEDLTVKVLEKCFPGNGGWYYLALSYADYCFERGLKRNRRAHYDWAHEMLGTVTVTNVEL